MQKDKLPSSAVNSKLWRMGGKGTQTRRLGFTPPTHFYEVYTPEVPVCQVPNILCCFMPLLFPLPEMFSPLICLANFSSSFKTQISDHLLWESLVFPPHLIPQSDICLILRLPQSWMVNGYGFVICITVSPAPSRVPGTL